MGSNPFSTARLEFADSLSKAIRGLYGLEPERKELLFSISSPQGQQCDISSSICFRLAQKLKRNPKELAEEVSDALNSGKEPKLIGIASAANGYVNSNLDAQAYSRITLEGVSKEAQAYGHSDAGKKERVIVESPSVNPNKPWLISHLRNALLGNVISNMLEACSYSVERENYIDDLGGQVAESLWGYLNLNSNPDKKFDVWLGEQYVEVNKIMKTRDIAHQIEALNKRMEEGNNEDADKAREFAERCLRAQYETSFSYGIYHNLLIWESDIVRVKLLDKAIAMLKENGTAHIVTEPGKYKGCLVVSIDKFKGMAKELEGLEEDTKVLIRSNGVATYLAKDIAFHMWKAGLIESSFSYAEFMVQDNGTKLYTTKKSGKHMSFGKADRIINVIGMEQKFPQLLLKGVFELMGYHEVYAKSTHLSYGHVKLESGSLHGRAGNWMSEGRSYTADDLLHEVKEKALEIIGKGNKVQNPAEAEGIATAVALSAIKFEYLRVANEKNIIFSWQKALDFESNSGPYCLYTYARAARIAEKGKAHALNSKDYANITNGKDYELVKTLAVFPDVVEKACAEYKPNAITDYALTLSASFSKFYESMPVLAAGDSANLRLAIVAATMQVMKNALALLGIPVVERM